MIDDKDLPIVLVHGTMGKSEDWSRVVEELSSFRSEGTANKISVDVREYAARIKAPTLLITAKHDQIVPPPYSEHLVPDAKTLELNSGHLIFLEKPVDLAFAILSFCQ
ncbi:hypothetical protein [Tunturiibacter gelidiferens]|uniref:alpha/beta fold hydrolase n=1 Tax=Tunturiibacter gelidiferens TaxID=3069689 RepID=UPI003D9BD98B